MYNLVSPMDYGSSLRSSKVRRRRNKAVRIFLMDNLALPLLKSLGRVAWNLIQSHYVGYFEDEMFAQRLKLMNSSEMIREFNLTLPADAIEVIESDESRPNTTLAFKCNGDSLRAQLYARYSAAFSPYAGYSNRYYARIDDMPPPTFPADSYPWLWSPRLNVTRVIASRLMQVLALEDENENSGSSSEDVDGGLEFSSSSFAAPNSNSFPQRFRDLAIESTVISSNEPVFREAEVNKSVGQVGTRMSGREIQALEQIQLQLQEFYFETGIPRFASRSNGSHSVFPSLAAFLRANLTSNSNFSVSENSGSGNLGNWSRAGSVSLQHLGDMKATETDFSTRSGVYAALVQFYAYPSVGNWVFAPDEHVVDEDAPGDDCTMEQQCLVQSGVTVYTPSLTNLTLFRTFATTGIASATKRAMRLEALLGMVQVAFEAERRALNHGLQGPSTVWYSSHDLDVDEFADAVLGTVNLSVSEDPTPLHVFEYLLNEHVPILDDMVSYYADTNHDTKVSMELNQSVPMLDKLIESELIELVSVVESQIKVLGESIAFYVETRAASPQYHEVVNATARGDLYNGSEYTLVGFGFIMPATNDKNVLYYDLKLPVPFHLALRLIIRFQESRLLLPEESRQLLVCLAMALNNISFYRCRPAATSATPPDDK
ncbi:hypothetical protein PRIC1_003260 [Phytophthora ramorum]